MVRWSLLAIYVATSIAGLFVGWGRWCAATAIIGVAGMLAYVWLAERDA
ncbi:hypothetical protein [Azospirillum himalayense]|uniref:Uncharacterized protein n=1 Tax=Azospirillum himalayense TaxID=654847 RepID=A0ABW0G940_9PROT